MKRTEARKEKKINATMNEKDKNEVIKGKQTRKSIK